MRAFKIFFVLMFIFLISCSKNNMPPETCHIPEPPKVNYNIQVTKTIYIDKKFNSSEKLAIISAKYEWEKSTKEIIKYNLVFDYEIDMEDKIPKKIIVIKLLSNDPIIKNIDEEIGEEFVNGTIVAGGGELIIIVSDRVSNTNQFKKIMMKEFGHDLGLPSIKKEGYSAVMNDLTPNVDCLTDVDLGLFCQKYLCNFKKLNYCSHEEKEKGKPTNKIDKL